VFKQGQMRVRWRLLWAATLGVMCLVRPMWGGPGATGDETVGEEYRQKANFLAMVPNFVEWPGDASAGGPNAFRICVFGTYPFGTELAELTRDATVVGKRVEVKWARRLTELGTCKVVFVSRSESKRYGKVLGALRGMSTLTVGETSDFLDAGGMVALETGKGELQFDVNLEAAGRAQLKISSRLLALARRVTGHAVTTRS
jgi:YfiR/HmsC-like